MFEEKCSIYENFADKQGRVGTLQEFLFREDVKPRIARMRDIINELGPIKGKENAEFKRLKQSLPCATISGVFSQRKDDCLLIHTGYIALDIDFKDNVNVSDMNNILFSLKQRPEVAAIFRSCSGTGFFAMVKIAYPEQHREQFAALMEDYAEMCITLDKSCVNVGRLRYASWDDEPYIRALPVVPYEKTGARKAGLAPKMRASGHVQHGQYGDSDVESRVIRLVEMIERSSVDITSDYNDWVRLGYALANLGEQTGRELFHRISRFNSGYKPHECDKQFNHLLNPKNITIASFFSICRDYGVVLRNN